MSRSPLRLPFDRSVPPVLGLLWLLAGGTAPGQIAVSDLSGTFNAVVKSNGTIMTDPFTDQQTGQKQADFISATAGTSVYLNGATAASTLGSDVPGFLVKSGTITNGGTDTYMMFRFRFQDANQTKNYEGSYIFVGLDLTNDGKPELMFGVDSTGTTPSLVFKKAGTGANDAPSTTTVTNYTTTATSTLNSSGSGVPLTFAYAAAPESYAATSKSSVQNMNLTFAISYTNLQQAIRDMGTVNGTDFSAWNVTSSTAMSFMTFSSGNPNAFNQDIYGGNITSSSSLTWTALGAFSTEFTADGQKKIVPEFSTFGQTGLLLGSGLGLLLWRRRRRRSTVAALSAPRR
ncbi:MAG: hypothetical protein HZA93_00730 [Verrucomicrobia bacterium]|nr:hypothetical protein [Verrucomicrobiota bacterium]